MTTDKNFAGRNGFNWFTGVVEDRFDPQYLGRVKINLFRKKKIRGLFLSDCLKAHVPVNQNRCVQIG